MTLSIDVQLYTPQLDFVTASEHYAAFIGGIGCLAGDTLVNGVPIAERKTTGTVTTLFGKAQSTQGFLKGKSDLYQIKTQSGAEVEVTLQHRFLTPAGWRPLSDLSVGDLIAFDDTWREDLDCETASNLTDDYCASFRQYDGLPTPAGAACPDILQRLRRIDAGNNAYLYHPFFFELPRSSTDCFALRAPWIRSIPADQPPWLSNGVGFFQRLLDILNLVQQSNPRQGNAARLHPLVYHTLLAGSLPFLNEFRIRELEFGLSLTDERLTDGQFHAGWKFLQTCESLKHGLFAEDYLPRAQHVCHAYLEFLLRLMDPILTALRPFFRFGVGDKVPKQFDDLRALSLPLIPSTNAEYSTGWTQIEAIKFSKCGEFYDLHVPYFEHYSACGLWHHNSGKSMAGCIRAALASQGYIGGARVLTPNLGVITAPTYTMLKDTTLRTFLEYNDPLIQKFNQSDMTMLLKNGSEILFRTADKPERLRGFNASWWFGDEAALYPKDVWRIMIGRLRQFGQHGYAWLASTPKGRNWLWQVFSQGQRAGYRMILARTRQNPFLSEDYIANLELEYAGEFGRQELDGEFVAFEGLIYSEFDRRVHIQSLTDARRFQYFAGGIDHGLTNPGVMLIGGVDGDGRLHVVHEEYKRQRRIEEWVNVGKQLRDTWNVQTWWADPSEPEYIKKYKEVGLKVEAANNDVNAGIQAVKQRLVVRADGRPRLTLTPDAVWASAEFEQYQWAKNRDGLRDQPVKANDHAMDALRYLVMGVDGKARRGNVTVEGSRWA